MYLQGVHVLIVQYLTVCVSKVMEEQPVAIVSYYSDTMFQNVQTLKNVNTRIAKDVTKYKKFFRFYFNFTNIFKTKNKK